MDAELEDGGEETPPDTIPERLQALMAQLRKAILQGPPSGQGPPDP